MAVFYFLPKPPRSYMIERMNMLVLEAGASIITLQRSDPRLRHITRVLKKGPGDRLLAGSADGRTGSALIETCDESGMTLRFEAEGEAAPLLPLALLLGFPRPIQANRIVKDLTSLGVQRVILSGSELGEKSYFQSDFFKNQEYLGALLEGAEQAANPRLPAIDTQWTLARSLELVNGLYPGCPRLCLDPYRAAEGLGSAVARLYGPGPAAETLVLAVGSERGWTDAELALMAERGFSFARLGDRILKSETAAVAAVSVALSAMGFL